MKTIQAIITSLLLFSVSHTFAMGGVWVLEVALENEEGIQRGFVDVDYWIDQYDEDSLILHPTYFEVMIEKHFTDRSNIIIYSNIQDQQILANHAPFPMHGFFVDRNSGKTITWADLKQMRCVKIWRKADYHVKVLSDIQLSDTAWFAGPFTVEKGIGDEVGCRLELYCFERSDAVDAWIEDLRGLMMKGYARMESEHLRTWIIIQQLYEAHVVVVELCGC